MRRPYRDEPDGGGRRRFALGICLRPPAGQAFRRLPLGAQRRDVDLRRQAFAVLQRLLDGNIAFDPFAPEALRRQQLAELRQLLERKAG